MFSDILQIWQTLVQCAACWLRNFCSDHFCDKCNAETILSPFRNITSKNFQQRQKTAHHCFVCPFAVICDAPTIAFSSGVSPNLVMRVPCFSNRLSNMTATSQMCFNVHQYILYICGPQNTHIEREKVLNEMLSNNVRGARQVTRS